MRAKSVEQGFTLIELMITVAVIGILVAIAMPSYNGQMRKSRRADAQSALMNVASRQQQMLLDTRAYAGSTAAMNVSVPANVAQHYTLTIELGTGPAPTFTAKATPLGKQAQDSCGELSINQAGVKLPANCW